MQHSTEVVDDPGKASTKRDGAKAEDKDKDPSKATKPRMTYTLLIICHIISYPAQIMNR